MLERITLTLDTDTVDEYRKQAEETGSTVEEVMSKRLKSCRSHTSSRPLYFDDKQRNRLEKLTGGHLLSDPEEALTRLQHSKSLTINAGEPVVLQLTDEIIHRLRTRAHSQSLAEVVTEAARRGIAYECNMG